MPVASGLDSTESGKACTARPSAGNSRKVEPSTKRCNRQWPRPAVIASRDKLTPCRKNSAATAILVAVPKISADFPCTGTRLASTTVPIKARVNLSGRIFDSRAIFQLLAVENRKVAAGLEDRAPHLVLS